MTEEQSSRAPRRGAAAFLVVLVLLVGTCVSLVAYATVEAGEDRYAGQVMDRYADEISEAISDRVLRYGAIVTDMAYAVGAQSTLSRDDFSRITAGLDSARVPGASGVGFIVPATTARIPAVQRYWRGLGATGLLLRPTAGEGEHEFVVYEKSFDDGVDMSGTDMTLSPQAGEVLETARNSGTLAMSPAYRLLRDEAVPPAEQQASVVLASPVTTGLGSAVPDEFAGWFVMGLRGQDFLSGTLLDRGQGVVQVSLADSGGAHTVIATAAPGRRADDANLDREKAITVAQRRWHISMWATERLRTTIDRGMSVLALTAGAALTVLLSALAGILLSSRDRALDQVDRATSALRDDIRRRERIETRLREREEELHRMAFHDPLTGLANRMLFYERLSHALTGAEPALAVLFIDLDGFKEVNDLRGHQTGDAVLRAIGDRLTAGIRAGDTVARFGGDEFAVILPDITGPDDARAAATRIIDVVQEPIEVDGLPSLVSASVGVAVARPGMTADEMIREADDAMYAAKQAGKNRYAEASA